MRQILAHAQSYGVSMMQFPFSAIKRLGTGFIAASLVPSPVFAADSGIDSGDTAWMLTATALVLLMTLPGLALFLSLIHI